MSYQEAYLIEYFESPQKNISIRRRKVILDEIELRAQIPDDTWCEWEGDFTEDGEQPLLYGDRGVLGARDGTRHALSRSVCFR